MNNSTNQLINSSANQDCDMCQGRGWIISNSSDDITEIQRCDDCNVFESDKAAGEAAAPILNSLVERALENGKA